MFAIRANLHPEARIQPADYNIAAYDRLLPSSHLRALLPVRHEAGDRGVTWETIAPDYNASPTTRQPIPSAQARVPPSHGLHGDHSRNGALAL